MFFKALRRRHVVGSLIAIPFLIGPVTTGALGDSAAQAQGVYPISSGPLAMSVIEARTVVGIAAGAPITDFKYLIVKEDTGTPNPSAPGCVPATTTCEWPSVRSKSGFDDIVTQGDQTDFANGTIKIQDVLTKPRPNIGTAFGPGRYLISVLAKGHKLGGAHFSLPLTAPVVTKLDAYPLPLANVRMKVFSDTNPVDGTYEAGAEAPLPGFTGHISDVLGEVTTDYFGNPLCTQYAHLANGAIDMGANGKPAAVTASPGCVSDANGEILIPNLGPDRYATTVVPPAGSDWVQTTTLEGGHDWDEWVAEGATGYDSELVVGAEKTAVVSMGYVPPATISGGNSTVKGRVVRGRLYIPGKGGINAGLFPLAGSKVVGPIVKGYVTLSDLARNDRLVHRELVGSDGLFSIAGVPAGDYTVTFWDEAQNHILDLQQVTVPAGQTVDVGNLQLQDWFTEISGTVFIDTNENGKRDAGEVGVPNLVVAEKTRNNSIQDQGANTIKTNAQGFYNMRQTYPLTRYLVLEVFDPRFRSTGITYQADNGKEVTLPGAAVDVNVLPIIGLSGRVDWGVVPYRGLENGGIVGTISYDTTRNELDPSKGAAESYQPGVPDIPVLLTSKPTKNADGSYTPGYDLADPYVSERWKAPEAANPGRTSCDIYDVNGDPIPGFGAPNAATQGILANTNPGPCIEAPFMSTQVAHTEFDPASGEGGTTVNGNYGFSEVYRNQFDPTLPTTRIGNKINVAADPNAIVPLVSAPTTTTSSTAAPVPPDTAAPPTTPPPTLPPTRPTISYLPQWAPLHCKPAGTGYNRHPDCNKAGTAWAGYDNYDYADQPVASGDYMVSLDIPKDIFGKPLYKPTAEEDVNVFNGDVLYPQENFGANGATTVDGWNPALVNNNDTGTPGPPTGGGQSQGQSEPVECAGALHVVHVTNSNFVGGGGSPYEGQSKNYCDSLLVKVKPIKAVAPTFLVFTEVPIPTHFWGIAINDLALSYDPKSTNFGEAYGIPNVPVGIYDWKGDLVNTYTTDPNGLYEGIEPSTSTYNCPLPAGPCPSMYRFVANDPGQPGHFNANYSSRYRTISATFQAWPGLFTVTDEAPSSVGITAIAPGTNQRIEVQCAPPAIKPQIFTVDRVQIPLPSSATNAAQQIVVTGIGFNPSGSTQLARADLVSEDGLTTVRMNTISGSDTSLVLGLNRTNPATVLPTASRFNESMRPGIYHLVITNYNGTNARSTTNGISVHVTSAGIGTRVTTGVITNTQNLSYNPPVVTVAPSGVIQTAIDGAVPGSLIVVQPSAPGTNNPFGAHYENLIVGKPIKLQGFGPGGTYADGTRVNGSVLSGLAWSPDTDATDLAAANGLFFTTGDAWVSTLDATPHNGTALVPGGAVITMVGVNGNNNVNAYARQGRAANLHASIDGFEIREGNQKDFPGNLNAATGQVTPILGAPSAQEQGGGIFMHANARNVAISNNVIIANGGAYGGAVRVGTPYVGNQNNTGLTIARNSIRDNGGVNLAGAIAIFNGSDNYAVRYNDLCGNFSVEYGGALTHFGLSQNGSIDHNRIWLNESFDEGGALMLAGQLPIAGQNPPVSAGSGRIVVDSNVIEANMANDDGGGIRMLQTNNSPVLISNNMIVNNVSTHEGAGISLDDAAQVTIKNDTIARNVTTATAATSDGLPAPSGISSTNYSQELLGALTNDSRDFSSTFSNPKIFNTILWENRAGRYDPASSTIVGLSENDKKIWDIGMVASANRLTLRYSATTTGPAIEFASPPANNFVNPANGGNATLASGAPNTPFIDSNFQVNIAPLPWRRNGNFIQSVIIAADLPSEDLGNYHLNGTVVAPIKKGAWDPSQLSNVATATAGPHIWPRPGLTRDEVGPLVDIDNECRGQLVFNNCGYNAWPPAAVNSILTSRPDMGADQVSGLIMAAPFPASNGNGNVPQRGITPPAAPAGLLVAAQAPAGTQAFVAPGLRAAPIAGNGQPQMLRAAVPMVGAHTVSRNVPAGLRTDDDQRSAQNVPRFRTVPINGFTATGTPPDIVILSQSDDAVNPEKEPVEPSADGDKDRPDKDKDKDDKDKAEKDKADKDKDKADKDKADKDEKDKADKDKADKGKNAPIATTVGVVSTPTAPPTAAPTTAPLIRLPAPTPAPTSPPTTKPAPPKTTATTKKPK
jgi:hypothetical protein